jgi:hypothetical protein
VNKDITFFYDREGVFDKHAYAVDRIHNWSKKSLMIRQLSLNTGKDIKINISGFICDFCRSLMIHLLQAKNINCPVASYKVKKGLLHMSAPNIECNESYTVCIHASIYTKVPTRIASEKQQVRQFSLFAGIAEYLPIGGMLVFIVRQIAPIVVFFRRQEWQKKVERKEVTNQKIAKFSNKQSKNKNSYSFEISSIDSPVHSEMISEGMPFAFISCAVSALPSALPSALAA